MESIIRYGEAERDRERKRTREKGRDRKRKKREIERRDKEKERISCMACYGDTHRLGGLGRFTYMCYMLYTAHFISCIACSVLHAPFSVFCEKREFPCGLNSLLSLKFKYYPWSNV